MQSSIVLPFGDGEYRFFLGMKQIVAIQEKCGAGIGEVISRICTGRFGAVTETVGSIVEGKYRVEDIVEVIRQGLIGGGEGEVDGIPVTVNEVRAHSLVKAYVLDCAIEPSWKLATAIVGVTVNGYVPPEGQKKSTDDETGTDDSTGQ